MDIFKDTTPKPTVLIVDDEPLVRMTIADMLRLGGFYVLEAASGSEALDVVANGHSVAALVSDIRMPAMDGVDLSHRVRAVHPEMPLSWYRARRALTLRCYRQERATCASHQAYGSWSQPFSKPSLRGPQRRRNSMPVSGRYRPSV